MATAIVAGAAIVGLAGGRFANSRTQPTGADGQADVNRTGPVAAQVAADSSGAGRGQQLYALHCASCHGLSGEGQPNWKVTGADGKLPAPPHDASGHTWHHPDQLLLQIIADGGEFYSPNTGMPGFREKLSAEQMGMILEHIKGMWGPDERAYQAEVSAESAPLP
jgi:mono/diheme cytochrome c family protein